LVCSIRVSNSNLKDLTDGVHIFSRIEPLLEQDDYQETDPFKSQSSPLSSMTFKGLPKANSQPFAPLIVLVPDLQC
jgi:hypothetical protein